MKIVINSLGFRIHGGGNTHLINLLQNLADLDLSIILLISSSNRNLEDLINDDKIRFVKLPFHSILFRLFWELFFLNSFLKKSNAKVYFAVNGLLLKRVSSNFTSVIISHNLLPFLANKFSRKMNTFSRFRNFILKYLFLKSYQKADKIIFISEYAKHIIASYLPNEDIIKKSVVIPHGISSFFSQTKATKVSNVSFDDYYLYVSSFTSYKMQLELLKAWKLLIKSGFKKKLLLIGSSLNKKYRKKITNEIQNSNLEGRVECLSVMPHEELIHYYSNAKALIFASVCENCPNILFECMASQKILFCSNHQPMPEFAKDTVVYFNPNKPEEIKNIILDYEQYPEKYEDLPLRANKLISKYTWANTSKKTFDFIIS